MEIPDRITALLTEHGVPFEWRSHAPVRHAGDAAEKRGTPLSIGGKALVMKLDRGIGFAVLALGGHRAVHNRMLRTHLGLRRYRFATVDELHDLTGLAPGCVPPFGRPLFEMPLFVDRRLAQGTQVAFTAGSHTRSILMTTMDWLTVASPEAVFDFSRPP